MDKTQLAGSISDSFSLQSLLEQEPNILYIYIYIYLIFKSGGKFYDYFDMCIFPDDC